MVEFRQRGPARLREVAGGPELERNRKRLSIPRHGGDGQRLREQIQPAAKVERPAVAVGQQQVPAVDVPHLDLAGDPNIRGRPLEPDLGANLAVDSEVAAVRQPDQVGERTSGQLDGGLDAATVGARQPAPARGKLAEALAGAVGPCRRAFESHAPVAVRRCGRNHVEADVRQVEDRLDIAHSEIDSPAANPDVRDAHPGCRGAGGAAEQRFEIPVATCGARQVDAGVFELQARELQAPGPQAPETDSRRERLDIGERFEAHRRIVVDDDFVHGESRTAKQVQVNLADFDLAAERLAQALLHACAEAVGVEERRDDSGCHYQGGRGQHQPPDRLSAQPHGSPPRAR